jgi:uncharacterized protein
MSTGWRTTFLNFKVSRCKDGTFCRGVASFTMKGKKAKKQMEAITMLGRKLFYRAVLILMALALALAAGCSAVSRPAVSAGVQAVPGGGGPVGSQPLALIGQSSQPVALMNRGITVVGTGKASGTPDVANISVGVETVAASVQQAVDDNKAKMTQLLDALQSLGIADKDIQTSNYGVYTERQSVPVPDGKGDQGPVSYHVTNQVNVIVRDVNKLGDVLDKVVAAGANNIYGVNFSVADTSKLQAGARAKAIEDAKSRAESLAKLAGVALGDVMSVSEIIGGSGPIYGVMESAKMGSGGGGAPIQPGELEVNMSVQVTFAIK